MISRKLSPAVFAAVVIASTWTGQAIALAQSQTPAAGANSFTEGEAKARIQRAGYAAVSDLKKDDQGVWRGTATRDGKPVQVGLDYKGDVLTP